MSYQLGRTIEYRVGSGWRYGKSPLLSTRFHAYYRSEIVAKISLADLGLHPLRGVLNPEPTHYVYVALPQSYKKNQSRGVGAGYLLPSAYHPYHPGTYQEDVGLRSCYPREFGYNGIGLHLLTDFRYPSRVKTARHDLSFMTIAHIPIQENVPVAAPSLFGASRYVDLTCRLHTSLLPKALGLWELMLSANNNSMTRLVELRDHGNYWSLVL